MNTSSTVTLSANTRTTFVALAPAPRQRQPVTVAQISRTLARKWDMISVIALMLSSAAYGIYAITCSTGF